MKPSLYIETSVISYLTARPSRDLVAVARQQVTGLWWHTRRHDDDLFVSPLVLEEAARGDADAAVARLDCLARISLVEPSEAAGALAERLLREVPLPPKAAADAVHIATAAMAGALYLLTWNFRHIANPVLRDRIWDVCRSFGVEPPVLCSPEELLESTEP